MPFTRRLLLYGWLLLLVLLVCYLAACEQEITLKGTSPTMFLRWRDDSTVTPPVRCYTRNSYGLSCVRLWPNEKGVP